MMSALGSDATRHHKGHKGFAPTSDSIQRARRFAAPRRRIHAIGTNNVSLLIRVCLGEIMYMAVVLSYR
jgi:hypothetical protein